jgi:moderate conductance mechanosensitive channel
MDIDILRDAYIQFSLVIKIVAILAIAYIGQMVAQKFIERVVRRSVISGKFKTKKDEIQREDTLISILKTATYVAIWVIAGLSILGTFDINIAPLLAGAGVVGVALGFGAQSVVRDILAGLFILLENQYRVGDVLQVNQTVAGVVEKITLRVTVMRDLDGKVHYVPNGVIEIATNLTMEYAQVDLNIGVSYSSDLDKVEAVINKVGESIFADKAWRGVVLEPATMLRVDKFADSAITVKIVCKTAPIRQWEVKSEILRRLKKEFDKEGIEIPFPQRVIHTQKS